MLQHALGSLFRSAGYRTVYGGKTHVPGKIDQYGFEVLTGDQRQGLADACVEFLKQKHDRPFLLVASFINPHDICYMAINDFERASPRKACQGQARAAGGQEGTAGRAAPVGLGRGLQPPPGVSEADFFANHCRRCRPISNRPRTNRKS